MIIHSRRDRIEIHPDSDIEHVYLEEVIGLKKDGSINVDVFIENDDHKSKMCLVIAKVDE